MEVSTRVAVPLSDIRTLEVKHAKPGMTVLLISSVVLLVAAIGLAGMSGFETGGLGQH